MSEKLMKYCLYFIGICLVISLTLFNDTDLQGSIFLDHYYELLLYNGAFFELSYLTNFYDDVEVMDIYFPALENTNIHIKYNGMVASSTEFNSRYKIKTISLSVICPMVELEKEILLDFAIIRFANGKTSGCNIGKIVLFLESNDDTKLVERRTSSATNTGFSCTDARFLDDVHINSLPLVLKPDLEGILKTYINDLGDFDLDEYNSNLFEGDINNRREDVKLTDYSSYSIESRVLDESHLPISFSKDEYVLIVNEFTIDNEDVRRYNRYNINHNITFENDQGQVDNMIVYNMIYTPYFSAREFYEHLQHKAIRR